MSEAPSVLVVDDHPLMRRGLRQLLELDGGLVVVAEAAGGEEALDLAQRLAPALVLLDVHMPQLDGVETLACLRHRGFTGKVVMISVSDAEADVRAAFRHGANGYLLKDAEPEELLARLRQVLAGATAMSPGLPPEWSRCE